MFWALMAAGLLAPPTGELLDLQLTPSPPLSILKAYVNAYFGLLSLHQLTCSVEKGQQSNNGLVGDMCSLLYNPRRTLSAKKTTSSCTQCREGDDKQASKYKAASRVREHQRLSLLV